MADPGHPPPAGVSLKAYVETVGVVALLGLIAVFFTLNTGNQKAIAVALATADEKAEMHNGLIRKGEVAAGTYVTQGQVYSALGTAIAILTLSMLYVANFGGK